MPSPAGPGVWLDRQTPTELHRHRTECIRAAHYRVVLPLRARLRVWSGGVSETRRLSHRAGYCPVSRTDTSAPKAPLPQVCWQRARSDFADADQPARTGPLRQEASVLPDRQPDRAIRRVRPHMVRERLNIHNGRLDDRDFAHRCDYTGPARTRTTGQNATNVVA